MAGIFDNFNNINTAFKPNQFQPKYPSTTCGCNTQTLSTQPNKPFELKNSDGTLKGYFWYKGNSVSLVFNINGCLVLEDYDRYMTPDQILEDLELTATFYNNHNYEEVVSFCNKPKAENPIVQSVSVDSEGNITAQASIDITAELSNTIFNKGIYRLSLIASHPCGYCETLFGTDTCIFEVK